MTLILSCITREYAIQVSDRLFTYIDPRTGEPINKEYDNNDDDDKKNKCVLLSDSMAFGYAGHGEINNTRTDVWLGKVLYSANNSESLSDYFNTIRDKATEVFSKIKLPQRFKRHAFVGVGWTQYFSENNLSPILVIISNYHSKGGKLLDEAQNKFDILVSPKFKRSDRHSFKCIGEQIPKEEMTYFRELNRHLKRSAKKNAPQAIMALLVEAARKIARKPNINTVGKNLLGICVPKSSVMRDHLPGIPSSKIFLSGPPIEGIGTFLYFPEGKDDGIQYGPTVVRPGASLTSNFKIGPAQIKENEESVKIWDVCNAVVLCEIIGAGSWTDTRRPEICDDYSLTGYNAYGKVPTWPSGESSPYYGSLYGINAGSDIIDKIEEDSKYVIVIKDKSSIHEIPNDSLLIKLGDWFTSRGMTQDELIRLRFDIDGLNRMELIEKLMQFLNQTRKNFV